MNRLPGHRYLKLFLSFIVLAIGASCAAGLHPGRGPAQPESRRQDLQQIIDEWRTRSNIPGAVVGLSLADGPEMLFTSGEADTENRVAMGPDHQFQIASITKTFIAAEILTLVSQGRLHLDAPLNLYLRETPHGDVVTIRHLLSHRSGYFDPIHDDPRFIPSLAEDLERRWSWNEMLAIAFQHDLFFRPGRGYRYSNTNYLLLALVIETLRQEPLGQVLTSSFLAPLRLEHTQYRTPQMDVHRTNLAHGYAAHPVTGEVVDTMSIPDAAILSVSTDTMISNVTDLLKWSRALYREESSILPPQLQEQMLTFDEVSPYGLGVFRFDTPVGRSFGHGGDTAGYLSLMEYFPEQDLSIVILVNADAPSINLSGLRDKLLVALFEADQSLRIQERIADLKSTDSSIRKQAIVALGHSSPGSEDVIQALIIVLKEDAVAENRKEAALALGLVGQHSEKALQALNDALQDREDAVREAAAIALRIRE